MGGVFTVMAWTWLSGGATGSGPFWLIPLVFLSIGVWSVLQPILGDAYLRRHTFYTLTNRNAYVARRLPILGKSLKTWPIETATPLDFEPGTPGSIFFATETRRSGRNTRTQKIGFERIADAAHVYRQMREVQAGRITSATPGMPDDRTA